MNSGSAPRVSVTMPVFNGEAYVTEAVNSVLAQTFRDFELVAVNDGSTDSTPDILASLASQDKRIRVFHHQPNKGIVAARNKALEMARGKYIAVMDADDVCLPERLAAQVAFLYTHPEVGALGSGVQGIDGAGAVSPGKWIPPGEHGVLLWRLCFDNPYPHSSVMMRRSLVERVGGYRPGTEPSEDYDLFRQLGEVTRLSSLQEVLLLRRWHGKSASKTRSSEQMRNADRIRALMVSQFLGEGAVPCEWNWQSRSAFEARNRAKMIQKLLREFVRRVNLDKDETTTVRRDAATRMYEYCRSWSSYPAIWPAMFGAFCLDPKLLPRVTRSRFLKGPANPRQ